MPSRRVPKESFAEALHSVYPELESIGAAAGEEVYLVGGAVRDLLLGRGRADLDLAVVGDPAALASALGAELLAEHGRFSTAKIELGGHEIDIAAARTEVYRRPGALPTVSAASEIEADLTRRDFTVNAMAVPLRGASRLIDPFDGAADLERELLRALHPGSFVDDPTRAIRAARYAARLDFGLEAETEELLRATNLAAVSADRRRSELRRLAAEASAPGGFELLAEWGLVELREGGVELARAVAALLATEPWKGQVPYADAVLAAALGPPGSEVDLAAIGPVRPSEAVELARGYSTVELALARALGAEWLDKYLGHWRLITLEIDGADLIAAGLPRGPAIGRGLAAALRRKLDGEIDGRSAELDAALEAVRDT